MDSIDWEIYILHPTGGPKPSQATNSKRAKPIPSLGNCPKAKAVSGLPTFIMILEKVSDPFRWFDGNLEFSNWRFITWWQSSLGVTWKSHVGGPGSFTFQMFQWFRFQTVLWGIRGGLGIHPSFRGQPFFCCHMIFVKLNSAARNS